MNSSLEMQRFRDAGLRPYQAELVSDILESQIPVRRLLVASPGLGKTVAAMSLAKEIAKSNPSYRILIIGPGVMAAMHEYHLAQNIKDAKVAVITRRVLRELEAEGGEGKPVWPAPFAAVIGMDTARQEDVRNLLCSVPWDLVVLEEVHLFARSRWTLLKTILSQEVFQRVLLITSARELRGIASLLKGVKKTEWIPSELKDWDGQPVFATRAPEFNRIPYRRGEDEIALLKNVLILAGELSSDPAGRILKTTLLRQAGSSPLALERTVRHLRNALTHGVVLSQATRKPGESVEGLETDADTRLSSSTTRTPWRSKAKAMVVLNTLLDQTESVRTDTKREAFESLLSQFERGSEPKPL